MVHLGLSLCPLKAIRASLDLQAAAQLGGATLTISKDYRHPAFERNGILAYSPYTSLRGRSTMLPGLGPGSILDSSPVASHNHQRRGLALLGTRLFSQAVEKLVSTSAAIAAMATRNATAFSSASQGVRLQARRSPRPPPGPVSGRDSLSALQVGVPSRNYSAKWFPSCTTSVPRRRC